jgi:glycosyltransferase
LKISIITACRNSSKSISSAIESVNNQTYEKIEHVFIDGLSSDDTIEKIKRVSQRNNIIVSEKDNGIYDALNKGINRATGDIIGFVHSDDFIPKNNVLQIVAKNFLEDLSLDAVYGDANYVTKNNSSKILRHWKGGKFSRKKMLKGWMPCHPSLFIKKQKYLDLGLFDLKYEIAADYDLIVRFLFLNDLNIKYLPNVFIHMRNGGESNKNIERIIKKTSEDYMIMKSHGIPALRGVFYKNISKMSQFL